jgi:hypothetical protein
MAANPIYVESEEEISEVVERLRRSPGSETMLVLPMRSRVGQSRFNFQLLRNYASGMGKRVTVVCDDPAVQKMAAESGFPVFGAVGPMGEGIPSEPEAQPRPRRWWERNVAPPTAHVGVAAPKKLLTKTATELKPGRFLLYIAAATLVAVGLLAAAIYVPSASVTLVAQAQPYTLKGVEIQAQPGKAPIHVRANTVSGSNSQSFKTTGLDQVQAALAFGQVTYTNDCNAPPPPPPPAKPPAGLGIPRGQRFLNTNGIMFAQTSGNLTVPWRSGGQPGIVGGVNVSAIKPGVAGNVGSDTILGWQAFVDSQGQPNNPYSCLTVNNPSAIAGGLDASSKPVMTESDFDAGRAQLEQELRQVLAQQLATNVQSGEKLSETLIYGAPQYNTDHAPGSNVPSFTGTMTLSAEGDFYVDADVQKAFQQYLSSRVPSDQQLLTESPIQVDYRILNASKGGNLTFLGNATAFVAPLLDQKKILAQIVGRPLSAAKLYLEKLPVRSVTIKEEPMTLPLMPLLGSRISMHYIVQPGTPANGTTTPGPSPSPSGSPHPSP